MADEVKDPEKMSLAELKAAALAAPDQRDEIDNAPEATPEPEPVAAVAEPEPEPEEYIVRREIDLGDRSGVQVFTGSGDTKDAAYEDLADQLTEAQRNATAKIREQGRKLKEVETRTAQQVQDEDFVFNERLKKEPRNAIQDAVNAALAAREQAQQDSIRAQERFVAAHPDYVANPDNGARISAEVRRHGYNEFTDESLEKAYQSLKASGLLALKAPEASGSTAPEPVVEERIVPAASEVPQSRSPRRSSTVSTRASRPVVQTEPTEDDLYKMPLAELRQRANKQLAGQ